MFKQTLLSLASVGCLGIFASSAQALEFSFSQGGFNDGLIDATLTGTFTGTDLDTSGILGDTSGEITDFTLSFSGNGLVNSFSANFSDFLASGGLNYDLLGGSLDFLTIQSNGGTTSVFVNSPSPTLILGPPTFSPTTSTASIDVQPVPTPAAVLPGLVGMGAAAIRKRKLASSADA